MGAITRSNQPLSAPEKLRADHDLSAFECGEPALDDWLRKQAAYIMRKAALPVPTWSVLGTKWPALLPLLSVP